MNKKAIAVIKDKLGGKIMKQCVGLRAKAYSQQMTKEKKVQKSVS